MVKDKYSLTIDELLSICNEQSYNYSGHDSIVKKVVQSLSKSHPNSSIKHNVEFTNKIKNENGEIDIITYTNKDCFLYEIKSTKTKFKNQTITREYVEAKKKAIQQLKKEKNFILSYIPNLENIKMFYIFGIVGEQRYYVSEIE